MCQTILNVPSYLLTHFKSVQSSYVVLNGQSSDSVLNIINMYRSYSFTVMIDSNV